MSQESLRQDVRAWLQDRIEGVTEFSLPAIAAEGARHFRDDTDFCQRFLNEFIEPVVYEVGLSLLSGRRAKIERAASASREVSLVPSKPTMYVPGEVVATAIEEKPVDWQQWLEHDPETGRHIVLFSMTREQALRAAEAREKRADPDLRRAGLLRLAAGTLEVGRPAYSLGKGTIYDMMQQGAA
jgi:hypothetical protein